MLWHDTEMKILIEFNDLIEIFFLHFGSGFTHFTVALGEDDLVDDYVVDVNLEFG